MILSYGSDFGKRIFVPGEKVEINFIILSMFGDSKISHKNVNYLKKKKKRAVTVTYPHLVMQSPACPEVPSEEAEVQHLE